MLQTRVVQRREVEENSRMRKGNGISKATDWVEETKGCKKGVENVVLVK